MEPDQLALWNVKKEEQTIKIRTSISNRLFSLIILLLVFPFSFYVILEILLKMFIFTYENPFYLLFIPLTILLILYGLVETLFWFYRYFTQEVIFSAHGIYMKNYTYINHFPPQYGSVIEWELISHIGRQIPRYKTWRRNLNFILSYMTMSKDLIPVMKSINELDPGLLQKFNVTGGLDDSTIDFLIENKLLEEQYAGTAKLLERVSKFITELGHPGQTSLNGKTFHERVRSAYDCKLISQNCYRDLVTHGKSAIHQLEESVFTLK